MPRHPKIGRKDGYKENDEAPGSWPAGSRKQNAATAGKFGKAGDSDQGTVRRQICGNDR